MDESDKLRDYFLGWQCRLRQHAVRKLDGRPVEGMRGAIKLSISDRLQGPVNTVLVRRDSIVWTDEFRHLVKKTHDPNVRFQTALKLLASTYYQHPKEFQGYLFASFAVDSELAQLLIEQHQCELHFAQYNQSFTLFCHVSELTASSDEYQSVYWHNSLFNATIPASITVLRFAPQWANSKAQPPLSQ